MKDELKTTLLKEFEDKDYAHSYMDSHLIDRIATQIYQLRIQRNWTQAELSNKSGIAQERISLLESGEFSSITMKTLRKLAYAFDVSLSIRFESFVNSIDDFLMLSEQTLRVEDRIADINSANLSSKNYANWFHSRKNLNFSGSGFTSSSEASNSAEFINKTVMVA